MSKCQFCGKKIKNKGSLAAHQMSCKKNPNRVIHKRSPISGQKKGCIPWNKGLKGVTKAWNKGMKGISTGIASTPQKERERRLKLSKIAKKNNYGGYIPGSGRGKKGWYKGIFCDSSWELAYLIYCLDHNKNIKRNTEIRNYIFKGKKGKYIPDFIVDDKLVEIKGYKTEKWLAKLKYNPDVKVLYEKDLLPIFEYVKNNYGKNFIELYEKSK